MKASIVIAIILVLGFMGLVSYHEQTHIEIYRSYGINSHVDYFSYFPHVATVAEEPCPSDICTLAHNNADSLMYMAGIFYIIFGVLLFEIISNQEALIKIKLYELKKANL